MHNVVKQVTDHIVQRSQTTRQDYLQRLANTQSKSPPANCLSCSNMAHVVAASPESDKQSIAEHQSVNIGIVTAYNDMLSAHQPLATYPDRIKAVARTLGATAQVAGGVPAMCDGVTQGQPGMELSLFSRDVIAMATAVSLTHNVFDAVICLGVCDKIVPGMLIGALQFAHLPTVFIPAGPMHSGISNTEKALVRQQFVKGEVNEQVLFKAESASYHSPGTCTFYGTANSNQLLMEMLGVQLPSSSFVNTGTVLRDALTDESVKQLLARTSVDKPLPLSQVVTEKSLVNAIIGLLATGGSTNHTLHIIAMAKSAGIQITWEDFDALSKAVPLLARVYPNGSADVNHFRDAGGIAYLVHTLRQAGLLHEDVHNIMGEGLDAYEKEPVLKEGTALSWSTPVIESRNEDILRSTQKPFDQEGGIRLVAGNLGKAIVKASAVKPEYRKITAPCKIFHSQEALQQAFDKQELEQDFVAVVRFQGPAANGMPELHKMLPPLAVLQDQGYRVALITDGRMSGASGKVLAAIHVTPEAKQGGSIARLQDGDMLSIDAEKGILHVEVEESVLAAREAAEAPQADNTLGRHLFSQMRNMVSFAEAGASILE